MKAVLSDRWTVLHHDPDRRHGLSKGTVSESWLCVDCGFNTAPGFLTRKQTDVAFIIHGVAKAYSTWDQEVYCLKDEVWRATGLEAWGGCLCIGCLEKRIGRRLKREDFLPDHPFNAPDYPASRRLRKRRGR
jgi:hypothetical protein